MATHKPDLTKTGKPCISRGDLLRVIAQCGHNTTVAALLGFEEKAEEAKTVDVKVEIPPSDSKLIEPLPTNPARDAHTNLTSTVTGFQIKSQFWYCQSFQPIIKPAAVNRVTAKPKNDPIMPPLPPQGGENVSRWQPLRTWRSYRNLLDDALSNIRLRKQPDVARAAKHLAAGRPLLSLPRLTTNGISGEIWLLIDYAAHLRPFWDDANDFWPQLKRLLGPQMLRLCWIEHGPLQEWQGEIAIPNHHVLPTHAQVLILSDLGYLTPVGNASRKDWESFGNWLANHGICAKVFSPTLPLPVLKGFKAHSWEGKVREAPLACTDVSDALLGALALMWVADWQIVRSLRHCIPGAKAADEVRCLQTDAVLSNLADFRIAESQLDKRRKQFYLLVNPIRDRLLTCIRGWRNKIASIAMF
jgi:hypothetical protein